MKDKLNVSMFGDDAYHGDLLTLTKNPLLYLPLQATILAVHACGGATDLCLHIGLDISSPCMFLLPCCHRSSELSMKNKLYVNARQPLSSVVNRSVNRSDDSDQNNQNSSNKKHRKHRWYRRTRPKELEDRLGRNMSDDIDRTYTLHEEGYTIEWAVLPPEITPMNRLIIAYKTENLENLNGKNGTDKDDNGGDGTIQEKVLIEEETVSLLNLWKMVVVSLLSALYGTLICVWSYFQSTQKKKTTKNKTTKNKTTTSTITNAAKGKKIKSAPSSFASSSKRVRKQRKQYKNNAKASSVEKNGTGTTGTTGTTGIDELIKQTDSLLNDTDDILSASPIRRKTIHKYEGEANDDSSFEKVKTETKKDT